MQAVWFLMFSLSDWINQYLFEYIIHLVARWLIYLIEPLKHFLSLIL